MRSMKYRAPGLQITPSASEVTQLFLESKKASVDIKEDSRP
ncbi:Uncharacterised protein [uncultured archaeon]|nr:Uncharacterised protein [uncultured archaeon]